MATPLHLYKLPDSRDEPHSVLNGFVALIPELYYGINHVFENSTAPEFSKKEGAVLWIIDSSPTADAMGKYSTVSDVTAKFREWLVVTEKSAAPEVSKAKGALLENNYIMILGGKDHLHLTPRGERAIREVRAKARASLEHNLAPLAAAERAQLLDIAERLHSIRKLPPAREEQKTFAFQQTEAGEN